MMTTPSNASSNTISTNPLPEVPSVSVLGLMNDKRGMVRLLIDADVLTNHEYFGCHPCVNTSSLKLKTSDLIEKVLPGIQHSYTLVDLPWS